tara:strand:- start:723 stop:863 length:141 start_codon:yes stop_codon:yes gene_type:complete
MRELLQDVLELSKRLVLLKQPREAYVVLAATGLSGFIAGLIAAASL